MSEQTTCSAIVSFAEKLECNSAEFYRMLAKRFTKDGGTFLGFAKECDKSHVRVMRTYRETISDAFEACFIQMDLNNYQAETKLKEDLNYGDALKKAIDLEEKAVKFYDDAAEKSKSLLATISVAFKTAAKNRNRRKLELKSLLNRPI